MKRDGDDEVVQVSPKTPGRTVSKVERFKWVMQDAPGVYLEIPKQQLRVDLTYQREKRSIYKINNFAAEWSWAACGVLIVADRDMEYYVVDGQNRLAAAMKRSDIRLMPCLVFPSSGVESEAFVWELSNMRRTFPNTRESHRAFLAQKKPEAMELQAMLDASRVRITDSKIPGGVRAMGVLYQLHHGFKAELAKVLPVVAEASFAEGAQISQRALRGAVWIERRLKGESLADERLRRRFIEIGLTAIEMSITRTQALGNSQAATNRVCGLGMLAALNKGLRNKIVLDEAVPDD